MSSDFRHQELETALQLVRMMGKGEGGESETEIRVTFGYSIDS